MTDTLKPFAPLKQFPLSGDANPEMTYAAIGRALTFFEMTEGDLAVLYNTIVRPTNGSFALRRSFGSLNSPTARRPMVDAGANVFFARFPEVETKPLQSELSFVLSQYIEASARRNEFAHGIVAPYTHSASDLVSGYYVGPNFINPKKRSVDLAPSYLYASHDINRYADEFRNLGNRMHKVSERLRAHFQTFPEEHRRRY